MSRYKIIFLMLFTNIFMLAQNSVKISGIIVDSAANIPLVSATVMIEGTKIGTLSNQSGWFSIDIRPEDKLKISLVGYTTRILKGEEIHREKLPVHIRLAERAIFSSEVVIESESKREKTLQLMGYEQLSASQIKFTPSIGGESDIMKTIQLLPGISTSTEISTKINVRGGESDQNLILIDGVQAYNPMHLLNFVSSFNTDAISNVELLKGYVSPDHYGKLSSVLKINLKEGNRNEHKWGGGISLISSQLYAEGPINKNSSYMFSLRRTYFDLFLKIFDAEAGYSFNDLYGKVSYHFGQKDHLYLSGYWGLDYTQDFDNNDNSNKWGNQVFHLKYNHLWSSSVFSDFSLSFSKYFSDLKLGLSGKNPFVNDYSIKNVNDINISNELSLKVGGDFHLYNFKVTSEMFSFTNSQNYMINAFEGNLFVNSKFKFNDDFVAEIGAVSSYFRENYTIKSYCDLEPRTSLCYFINDETTVKFAYIMMHQYVHTISSYNYSLPGDVFYPSSANLPRMKGNQISFGAAAIARFLDSEFDVSADLYYNDMKDVPNFRYNFENADPLALSDQVIIGKGWGYGAELQIRKAEGRLSGWLNYTWSYAKRSFHGKNNDKPYDPKFHKTHQINLVVNYDVSKSVKMGATYVISTGQPMTLPLQKFYINNRPYVSYDEINKHRLPYYSRLDISIVHFFNMWKGNWELSASVYNLLMRKNPTFLYYDFYLSNFERTSLGLLPTVGIKFHY